MFKGSPLEYPPREADATLGTREQLPFPEKLMNLEEDALPWKREHVLPVILPVYLTLTMKDLVHFC